MIRLCLQNGRQLTNKTIWVVCSHANLLINVFGLILIAPNCIPIFQIPTAFRRVPARKMPSSAVPIQMLILKAGLVTKSIHDDSCEKLFNGILKLESCTPQAFFACLKKPSGPPKTQKISASKKTQGPF